MVDMGKNTNIADIIWIRLKGYEARRRYGGHDGGEGGLLWREGGGVLLLGMDVILALVFDAISRDL